MIYFDSKNPNKYAALKKLLVPHSFYDVIRNRELTKKRYGKGDGSYVLCPELITPDSAVLSYGIGEDVKGTGFERELAPTNPVFCYDPNPKSMEALWGVSCSFSAEALTKDNFKYHCAGLDENGGGHILKMDIEGAEYDWLTDENMILLRDNFSQFTIEVHGLIEEIPDKWVFDEGTLRAKKDMSLKEGFFKKINSEFALFHIHANNHSPRYVDFPDSLELTYIKYQSRYPSEIDMTSYPKEGLDEPNYEGREDYALNWWI